AGLPAVIQVSAGDTHVCALAATGDLYCWGANKYGQLGNGQTNDSSTPLFIAADVARIRLGNSHSCAISATNGPVSCWGYNFWGQASTTKTNELKPKSLGLNAAVDLALGSGHSCALLAEGSVRCWGTNQSGELGDGTKLARSGPIVVAGLSDADEI